MTVAVFGSINADLNLTVDCHPLPGETVLGGGGTISAGGKGANQALAARLAGASTVMLGQVGRDANAGVALDSLRRAGVNLDNVQEVAAPTGLAVVSVSATGENSIIVVPGANALMDVAELEWVEAGIAQADVVVMQGEIPAPCMLSVAQLAIAKGKRVIFNLAPAIEVDPWLLYHSNPLITNEFEARSACASLGLPTACSDEAQLAHQLLAAGVPSVVITLGAKGAIVGFHDELEGIHQLFVQAVATPGVDTVGAGDAFVGVLAAGLDSGRDLVSSARSGVEFASATVRFTGAQSSYWQARKFLEESRQ